MSAALQLWQPIATAPLDREILARDEKWQAVITVSGPPDYPRPVYRFSHFAVCQEYDWEPTEWCEIPSAAHNGGWQPIETAPRCGEVVLAYFPLVGLHESWCRVVPVYWVDDDREWIFASRAASGFSKSYLPTHWMPLPTPPKGPAND